MEQASGIAAAAAPDALGSLLQVGIAISDLTDIMEMDSQEGGSSGDEGAPMVLMVGGVHDMDQEAGQLVGEAAGAMDVDPKPEPAQQLRGRGRGSRRSAGGRRAGRGRRRGAAVAPAADPPGPPLARPNNAV
jgi:hypothetical protein